MPTCPDQHDCGQYCTRGIYHEDDHNCPEHGAF